MNQEEVNEVPELEEAEEAAGQGEEPTGEEIQGGQAEQEAAKQQETESKQDQESVKQKQENAVKPEESKPMSKEEQKKFKEKAKSQPPPKPIPSDNLFLMEIIVDKIHLDYCIQKSYTQRPGNTCISFQFLQNDPFTICEEDFSSRKKEFLLGQNDQCLRNGRNILFSLNSEQITAASKKFEIKLELTRKPYADRQYTAEMIGRGTIELHYMFQDFMKAINKEEIPSTKSVKDCYKVYSSITKEATAYLSIYLRITCLGKQIINTFQMDLSSKTMDFKTDKGNLKYRFDAREKLKPLRISDPIYPDKVVEPKCKPTIAQLPCRTTSIGQQYQLCPAFRSVTPQEVKTCVVSEGTQVIVLEENSNRGDNVSDDSKNKQVKKGAAKKGAAAKANKGVKAKGKPKKK